MKLLQITKEQIGKELNKKKINREIMKRTSQRSYLLNLLTKFTKNQALLLLTKLLIQ